jgi:hypothetical protein
MLPISTGWRLRRVRREPATTRSQNRACLFARSLRQIGRGLKVPVVSVSPAEAGEHFGWLGFLIGHDVPASSALTQARLGWRPTQARLIADLNAMKYFAPTADAAVLRA